MNREQAVTAILLLYLAIATNFIKELFSCELQYQLSQNLWLKHVVGILVFYFAIVSPSILPGESPVKQLGWSTLLYMLFFCTTRCDYRVALGLVMLGVIIVIRNNYIRYQSSFKQTQSNDSTSEKRKEDDRFTKYVTAAMIVILIIGVIAYIGYKYMTLQKEGTVGTFDWKRFVIGVPECPQNAIIQHDLNLSQNITTELENGLKVLRNTVTIGTQPK